MNRTDWTLLYSYLFLHLIVGIAYFFNLLDSGIIGRYYFVLPFAYAYFIYTHFYHRLWNKNVLLTWAIVGGLQLMVYFIFKDNPQLQNIRSNDLTWLKGVPITIVTYYGLNSINNKLFGDNYIVTTLRLLPDEVLKQDQRKLRPMDYMFSGIGFMIILMATILTP